MLGALREHTRSTLGRASSTLLTHVRQSSNHRAAPKPNVVVELRQAYPGLGTAGQLVEVRPGFARNFLVPRGLARLLNHFQGKEFKAKYAAEQQEQRDAGKRAQQGDVMNQVLERLTTHTVLVRSKPVGGVLPPVTAKLLSNLVEKQLKVELDARCVDMRSPPQTFGAHAVPLLLDPIATNTKPGTLALKVHIVDWKTKKKDLPVLKPPKKEKVAKTKGMQFDDSWSDAEEMPMGL